MKKILNQIKANFNTVNRIGGLGQATLYAERLSFTEFRQVFHWLIKNKAYFQDDTQSYKEMGNEDTFHLWLSTPAVKLHIGFCFQGECDMVTKYALAYKKQLTI
jgi:hypothetical protein